MNARRAPEPKVSFFDRTKHFARHLPHRLSQPARNTAVMLWLHAHDDGTDIYLSVETLMSMTALPRRGQFRALKELMAAHYLIEDGWKVYSNTLRTRRRRLNLEKMQADRAAEIAALGGDTGVTVASEHSDTVGAESDTHVTWGDDTRVTKTFPSEPTKEPPLISPNSARCASWMNHDEAPPPPDLLGKPDDLTPAAGKKASKRAANASLDVAALVETWNRICGPKLGKVTRLSETRRQTLLKRMNDEMENDPAQWERFCQRVVASRFLTGVKTDFKADFDWCLTAKYSVRILEGIYNRDPEDQVDRREAPRRFIPSPGTI